MSNKFLLDILMPTWFVCHPQNTANILGPTLPLHIVRESSWVCYLVLLMLEEASVNQFLVITYNCTVPTRRSPHTSVINICRGPPHACKWLIFFIQFSLFSGSHYFVALEKYDNLLFICLLSFVYVTVRYRTVGITSYHLEYRLFTYTSLCT